MKGKIDISEYTQGNGMTYGIISFLIVMALFSVLFNSFYIVNTSENGILLQFGEIKDILQPGLHLKIPFVEDVKTISTQTMLYTIDASAASSDLQIVKTTIAVNYKIKNTNNDISNLYKQFRLEHESRIIAPTVQESVKAETAKNTAEDLIKRREVIKNAITTRLTNKLDEYGIVVEEVSVTNFDFSKEFNDAIEAKVVVEQQKAQAQIELEKKQIEVQKTIVEKNASAISQIIQANADAQSNILLAEGEANATLTKAEAQRKAIDMIQNVLTNDYISYAQVNKWNGQLPYYSGSDANLLLQMK